MRNWYVVRSLGWYGNCVHSFTTKDEAEAFAAKEGGKVMTRSQYELMRM